MTGGSLMDPCHYDDTMTHKQETKLLFNKRRKKKHSLRFNLGKDGGSDITSFVVGFSYYSWESSGGPRAY